MRPRIRAWAASVLLVLTLLPMSACNLNTLKVRIVDFDTSEVLGIRLWHLSTDTDTYEPHGEILLTEPYVKDGREVLEYQMVYDDGTVVSAGLITEVFRHADDPDIVELQVLPPVSSLGTFKLSAFNDAGESGLSVQTAVF